MSLVHADGGQEGVAYPFFVRVAQLKAKLGWTDAQLEQASGVTIKTFKRLRTIKRRPRARVVNDLAKAVGLDPDEAIRLAGLVPNEEPPTTTEHIRQVIATSRDFDAQQRRMLLHLVDVYTEQNNQRRVGAVDFVSAEADPDDA